MSEFKRNTAGQRVGFTAVATDGTGANSGVNVTITLDGASPAPAAGTLTHLGIGHWDYQLTQADSDANHILLAWQGDDIVPGSINILTTVVRLVDLQAVMVHKDQVMRYRNVTTNEIADVVVEAVP